MTEKISKKPCRPFLYQASLFMVLVSTLLFSCKSPPHVSDQLQNGWCAFTMSRGNTAEGLGMADYNAGYNGFLAPVKPGEKIVVRGGFPHCRYASFTIYDQDFMFVDKLTDGELAPVFGKNPFWPGVERGSATAEYEIHVLMDKAPAGDRPANTLYAGVTNNGKPNKFMIFAYRAYLADKGYGFRDGHPLAVYGGVEPPKYKIIDKNGQAYCTSKETGRKAFSRTQLSILWANRGKMLNPVSIFGKPQSPPRWGNNASSETQRANTYVPNDDTAYIASPISNKLGELLVLRWKPATTPEPTYLGKPFPKDYDMRYWSLSFVYLDRSRPLLAYSEKTLADVDVPILPDGSRQVVIGMGGMPKPEAVPSEQWVSVNMKEGLIVMRNILITPGYAGNFFKLSPGKIGLEFDKYTPGGVYCSAREFAQNPEIGLERIKLLEQK